MPSAIPYHVEINRIIELLATQIYQTPLALLRENCQNAYDAVLERSWLDSGFTDPQITIDIEKDCIRVTDNGKGMTSQDLDKHYWRAGSSGKNNPESRAAGVVGTFGIGAMANFGIASGLTVTTESSTTGQRTRSSVEREKLSATEPCISIVDLPSEGRPGTTVAIAIAQGEEIDVAQAKAYITEAVKYVPAPVIVNGDVVSDHEFLEAVPLPTGADPIALDRARIAGGIEASLRILVGVNGEPWVHLTDVHKGPNAIAGEIILAQDRHQIHAYRTGFSLAATAVQSCFGLGGIANLSCLSPTAGREALTTESVQFLQTIVTGLERLIAERLGDLEASDNNTKFMHWVRRNGRFDLCNHIKVQVEPGTRYEPLGKFSSPNANRQWNLYSGRDQSIMDSFATEEQPLIVLSATRPRRDCQEGYLSRQPTVNCVPDRPTVIETKPESKWSLGESALAFRLSTILESDYFVPCNVQFGKITHGLPLVVESESKPVVITLDSQSSTISPILQLYETDYEALTGFVKDFIRNAVFSKISRLVPSSTRQGAAAFLKSIRRPRDLFEYEQTDMGNLSDIWHEFVVGQITMIEAARRSAAIAGATVQILDPSSASTVEEVLSDVVSNDRMMSDLSREDELAALPAITRPDLESEAKILLVAEGEEPLRGYRGFLALTDRARRENADFFLQPHRTQVVWGGQKAIFIFEHHSGEFSFYYDLEGKEVLPEGPAGCQVPSCTIVVRNRVYIPIPEVILPGFRVGPDERKSFEVRFDLLFPEPPT